MTSKKQRFRTACRAALAVVSLAVVASLAGCRSVRGVVNASPGLRWWLFSRFGAERMCPEMLKRGAPLKLAPGQNTIGRFFPSHCRHEVNEGKQTIAIHFGGTGYAWTPLAGRIGFSAEAAVEYRPDFQMTEDGIYVWAKTNRILYGPRFSIGSVENKMVDWATRTPAGYLVNTFGSQIVSSQLTSGFTVIRTSRGDEFSVGILVPPARPVQPFDVSGGDRLVYANETTEIHHGQVDFLGPFEIADDDQALFFRFRLQGPALDALALSRRDGDAWRDALQRGAPLGPPPVPPLKAFPIRPGDQTERVRLAEGSYYLVVDNSARVGIMSPPWNPLSAIGGNTAALSYTAELAEL